MRIFKNISLQGFSVPFTTPQGIRYIFVGSKKSVTVPDSWSSQVANNLVARRMFKITSVQAPEPVKSEPVRKEPVIEAAPTITKRRKSTPREDS